MLEVLDLAVSYGPVRALHEVCIKVKPGKITSVIGSNGAGKSTLLKAIAGLVPAVNGSVLWQGSELVDLDPVEIVKAGIVMVPEGRGMLNRHTVYENLELGALDLEFAPKPVARD